MLYFYRCRELAVKPNSREFAGDHFWPRQVYLIDSDTLEDSTQFECLGPPDCGGDQTCAEMEAKIGQLFEWFGGSFALGEGWDSTKQAMDQRMGQLRQTADRLDLDHLPTTDGLNEEQVRTTLNRWLRELRRRRSTG